MTPTRNEVAERLLGEAARTGWMMAEASDIGAPSIEEAAQWVDTEDLERALAAEREPLLAALHHTWRMFMALAILTNRDIEGQFEEATGTTLDAVEAQARALIFAALPAAAPAEGLREALAAAVIQTGRQLVLRTNDEPNDGLYEVAAAMERNLAALARHESGSE